MISQLSADAEMELMHQLKQFDTPSITNVVATYPKKKDLCLGLYDPWHGKWYTDQSLKCIYPSLERRVGHVVTAVYGLPDPSVDRLGFTDILEAVHAVGQPVILCLKQDMPEDIKNRNGLVGGLMANALKKAGATGLISDGPSRDIDEIRELDFQYMLTGICAGHGYFSVKAVNVPVHICGMDVCPGEMIHMDENGAVKFPRQRLADIYNLACTLRDVEAERISRIKAADGIDALVRVWAY